MFFAREVRVGRRVVAREYAIEENPWFVKAGAIIPMYPDTVANLASPGTDDLVLFFAPGASRSRATVYEDDGVNADYATNFRRTEIVRDGCRVTISPRKGAYTLKFPCLAQPRRVTVNGAETAWSWDDADCAVVVRTPRMDGSRPTVIELAFDDDAATTDRRLFGMKGVQREVASVTEDLKAAFRKIHWAINLPRSWQTFWQAPSLAAETPGELSRLLEERETALRTFMEVDLPRYEAKLPKDLVARLRALYGRFGQR